MSAEITPISKRVFRLGYAAALRVAPRNRHGDAAIALLDFIVRHRRLPSDRPIFNDVLYKIKTTDQITDPLRVFVSDKEFVKLYVKAVVGDKHNVPTLDVIRSPEALDSYIFPAECCIKPTHLSGHAILYRGAEPLDRNRIRSWFTMNYYKARREANYKTLTPKIIIEPLVFGSTNVQDFKIFCCKGRPRLIQVDLDRQTRHTRKLYDVAWNELPFSILYPRTERSVQMPANLDEMLRIAASLSRPFEFIRVDLYSNGDEVLVGELTNVHGNAAEPFIPPQAEFETGWIFGECSIGLDAQTK